MTEYTTVQHCARNHTERKTHLNLDPPQALAASGSTLCKPCIERIRYRLAEIPDLAGHIRDMSVPGLRSSLGGGPKVDGSRDWKEPINRAAQDDVDGLWATLAYFAQQMAHDLALRPPSDVGTWMVTGVTTGADHHVTRAAAKRVTDWMLSWLDEACTTDLGQFMHDDLVPLIGQLRSKYGFRSSVRRATPRPCSACGAAEVRVEWNGDMPTVACSDCRFRQPFDWGVISGAWEMADVQAGRKAS